MSNLGLISAALSSPVYITPQEECAGIKPGGCLTILGTATFQEEIFAVSNFVIVWTKSLHFYIESEIAFEHTTSPSPYFYFSFLWLLHTL